MKYTCPCPNTHTLGLVSRWKLHRSHKKTGGICNSTAINHWPSDSIFEWWSGNGYKLQRQLKGGKSLCRIWHYREQQHTVLCRIQLSGYSIHCIQSNMMLVLRIIVSVTSASLTWSRMTFRWQPEFHIRIFICSQNRSVNVCNNHEVMSPFFILNKILYTDTDCY